MKRAPIVAGLAVVGTVLLAGGCADTSYNGKDPSDTVSASKEQRSKKETGEGSVENETLIHVGLKDTVKWRDDVTARLSNFKRGKSTESASLGGAEYLRFKVTLDNAKGKESLDLSMTSVTCSTGEEIFDFEDGLTGAPNQQLLPGRERSWEVGCEFGGAEEEVQIEVTPGTMDEAWYRPGVFTGKIG